VHFNFAQPDCDKNIRGQTNTGPEKEKRKGPAIKGMIGGPKRPIRKDFLRGRPLREKRGGRDASNGGTTGSRLSSAFPESRTVRQMRYSSACSRGTTCHALI
jgi:hypothetical protein